MPQLRAHRRDHRQRAGKRRKRRNLAKFIPEGDSDFALTANNFAHRLSKDPARHGVTPEQAAEVHQVVRDFRQALLQSIMRHTRTKQTILLKEVARNRAEEVIRRTANIIRANPDVSDTDKMLLRLKKRRPGTRGRKCPQDPPLLRFLGSGDGVSVEAGIGNGSGVHVLEVRGRDTPRNGLSAGQIRRTKPDGAVRVEIFVELVPVGQDVPHHPAELTGRPWYLGSFTTSRIEVSYPIPSEPMLVVYWARWADARGGVGRFSKPCPARIEGWTRVRPALPESDAGRRIETKVVFVQVSRHEPEALPAGEAFEEIESPMPRRRLLAAEQRELGEAV